LNSSINQTDGWSLMCPSSKSSYPSDSIWMCECIQFRLDERWNVYIFHR
jgi:hypothetical protein